MLNHFWITEEGGASSSGTLAVSSRDVGECARLQWLYKVNRTSYTVHVHACRLDKCTCTLSQPLVSRVSAAL